MMKCKSDTGILQQKLYNLMLALLQSNDGEIKENFSENMITRLVSGEITEGSFSNIEVTEKMYFKGYPDSNLLWNTARILELWMHHGSFPINFYEISGFEREQTGEMINKFNHLTPTLEQIKAAVEEKSENVIALVRQFLIDFGERGILLCQGARKTTGSVSDLPLPQRKALVEKFNAINFRGGRAEAEEGKKSHILTVGARALCKHAHRSSEGFWGIATGTETKKNEHANEVINRILNECTWINVHLLPHDEVILEARVSAGYGARWSVKGTISFRGFLEPQIENGHSMKWRH
eukprot:CAMPEP_0114991954 /NCGR_PEP_ID=MMETSP0216-20121206/11668_1 /TAXON_ID=223996 /ORGANISM="Protocruzia adherens, Strain Boccale" /LENGTH=293 /DNA_ID=CAMNT_0002355357 /DNA_START=416 /DNA_END=1297 /DNA_ORIENTATION=-